MTCDARSVYHGPAAPKQPGRFASLCRRETANGPKGVYDRVEYRYNRQGERTEKKDQNGTIHEFEFDKLGRPLHDRVTTLGAGVDGAVRRLSREYEVRGMLARAASYDNATVGSGSVVNDVTFEFDSLALLTKEYQEHSGAKGGSTPYVGYNYDTTAAGGLFTKGSRRTSVRYPNGRLVFYDYASAGSTADAINRTDAIKDNSGGSPGATLAAYSYLGLSLPSPFGRAAGGEGIPGSQGGIVQVDYQEPDIRFDLAFGVGSDPYDGLDRFDRVVDHLWRNYGNSTDAVRIKHGYDRAGNRLWREDPVAAASSVNLDELYGYDGMFQLKSRQRGDINAGHTAISSKNFAEDWTLDMTGNWPIFKQDTDGNGTWDLNQSRTHDVANEITQIAGSSTHVAHDLAGNMTKVPKPDNWSAHYDLTFDAWNRLVKVMDGVTTVATYGYDGRNFRVSKSISGTTRHFYYNNAWQCLEERLGSSTYANRQYLYGLRYVDDLLLRDRDADGSSGTGNLGLSGSGLEERLYCLQDANWNVVGIASTGGVMQERYCYTAYGKPTFLTGSFGSRGSSSYAWDALYTGRQYDAESGLGYNRRRPLGFDLGRFLGRDPIRYWGSAKFYRYCRNNPIGWVDPSGEDFIAIADRRVSGSMGIAYHYSVQYWTSCKKFEPLNHTKGFSEKEILKKNRDAKEVASVEVLVDTGWSVWSGYLKKASGDSVRTWKKTTVKIAVVHYSDIATKIMPIYDDTPKAVKEKWDRITAAAKGYSWAEQDGFDGAFVNWPRSMYKALQTNSNTFARYVVKSAGLTFVEMAGNHQGNSEPSQNEEDFFTFFPDQTPWKGGDPKPQPSNLPPQPGPEDHK